ncbi:MAG: hypothetical protein K2X77_03755 [Candidatus Obscuribacterales bacterium]|nr:hypothetical protein [Candidatus Obscuribacterales bacterium]
MGPAEDSFTLRGSSRDSAAENKPQLAFEHRPSALESELLHPGMAGKGSASFSSSSDLDALRRQITLHQKEDEKRSYLGSAISYVTELIHGKNQSLSSMETLLSKAELLQQQGNSAELAGLGKQINEAIKTDNESLVSASSWSRHSSSFVKSVGLFLPKAPGFFVSALTSAADSARASDSALHQGFDLALGAGKGLALKWSFDKIAASEMNLASKAFLMSTSSRLAEVGLNSHTYINQNTGNVDIPSGLWSATKTIADPAQIVNDMALFGGTYLALRRLGIGPEFAKANPLLSQTMVGGGFGVSGGFFGELQRQRAAGEELSVSGLLKNSLIEGGLSATAAAIGGYRQIQLDRAAQSKLEDFANQRKAELSSRPEQASSPLVREFVAKQDVSGLLERLRAGQPALLEVREVLGGAKALGPEKTMLVQHLEPGGKINTSLVDKAKIVACCGIDALGSALQGKHLFGKGDSVTLQVPGSRLLRFSLGDSGAGLTPNAPALALGGGHKVSDLIRKMDINSPFALTKDLEPFARAMEHFNQPATRIIGGVTNIAIELQNGRILRVTDQAIPADWGRRTLKVGDRELRMDAKLDSLQQVRVGKDVINYYLQDKLQSPVSAADLKLFERLVKQDGKYDFWDNYHGVKQLGYETLPNGTRGIVLLDYDAVRPKGQAPDFSRSERFYDPD